MCIVYTFKSESMHATDKHNADILSTTTHTTGTVHHRHHARKVYIHNKQTQNPGTIKFLFSITPRARARAESTFNCTITKETRACTGGGEKDSSNSCCHRCVEKSTFNAVQLEHAQSETQHFFYFFLFQNTATYNSNHSIVLPVTDKPAPHPRQRQDKRVPIQSERLRGGHSPSCLRKLAWRWALFIIPPFTIYIYITFIRELLYAAVFDSFFLSFFSSL